MEELRQTHVATQTANLHCGRRLGDWLRQRDFIQRSLIVLAGLSLLTAVSVLVLLFTWMAKGTPIVILDSDRNCILAEGTSFADAPELHAEMADLATLTLLSRGPKGPDLGAFLPRLFSHPAQELAEQLVRNEQPDFAQRLLRQKPEIASIEGLKTTQSSAELRIVGQLVRSGIFAGQAIQETVPFTLRLSLARNPNMLRAGRYPAIVSAFKLSYENHP